MSAGKVRRLIRSGDLKGYKHGRDIFIAASELRAFIQRKPVEPAKPIVVNEPHPDSDHDVHDDIMVTVGLVPTDPEKRRAFDARIARRRAEGGERAATLRHAEQERIRMKDEARQRAERKARRDEKKRRRRP